MNWFAVFDVREEPTESSHLHPGLSMVSGFYFAHLWKHGGNNLLRSVRKHFFFPVGAHGKTSSYEAVTVQAKCGPKLVRKLPRCF